MGYALRGGAGFTLLNVYAVAPGPSAISAAEYVVMGWEGGRRYYSVYGLGQALQGVRVSADYVCGS